MEENMKTEAQKQAQARYRKKMKQVAIEFSPNEMDIYEYLDSKGGKAAYIKELIRKDMAQ